MQNFEFKETYIKDLHEINAFCVDDERGFFSKTFEENVFAKNGIEFKVVETLFSSSKKGVLRGLHFQVVEPQAKLVSVTYGEVFDVAVDLRPDSETFLKWYGTNLSAKNHKMLYIPTGFAHGVMALSDEVSLVYQCDNKYYKEYDSGIIYNDTDINVEWPDIGVELIVSEKDRNMKTVKEMYKI